MGGLIMKPPKKLTQELKDLDVDRVDAVDRPAHGRAFALFKSEDIHVLNLIAKAQADCIVKAIDANDRVVGYFVQGSDVRSPLFKTLREAEALVERVIRGELAGKKDKPEDETDLPTVAPGNVAPLADASVNADSALADKFPDDEDETQFPMGPQSAKNDKNRRAFKRARLAARK